MAFRDILVYLDPTSESLERLRLAVELAKTHGARLIGVDISAGASENAPVTGRTFDEATRAVGLDAVFVPAEKPGDGEALTLASTSLLRQRPTALCATCSTAPLSTAP
jgi:hypothetical protein